MAFCQQVSGLLVRMWQRQCGVMILRLWLQGRKETYQEGLMTSQKPCNCGTLTVSTTALEGSTLLTPVSFLEFLHNSHLCYKLLLWHLISCHTYCGRCPGSLICTCSIWASNLGLVDYCCPKWLRSQSGLMEQNNREDASSRLHSTSTWLVILHLRFESCASFDCYLYFRMHLTENGLFLQLVIITALPKSGLRLRILNRYHARSRFCHGTFCPLHLHLGNLQEIAVYTLKSHKYHHCHILVNRQHDVLQAMRNWSHMASTSTEELMAVAILLYMQSWVLLKMLWLFGKVTVKLYWATEDPCVFGQTWPSKLQVWLVLICGRTWAMGRIWLVHLQQIRL